MLGLCENMEKGAVEVRKKREGAKAGPIVETGESSGWAPITGSPSASPAAAAV